MHLSFKCSECSDDFVRYVAPGDKKQVRKYCSRACQMRHQQRLRGNVRHEIEFNCSWCGIPAKKYLRPSAVPEFCSKKCAAASMVASGIGCFASHASRIAAGADLEGLTRESYVKARQTSQRNSGRRLDNSTREAIRTACTGISNVVKGKTFDEFYGADRSLQLRTQHSEALKAGYRSGRLMPPPRKIKGKIVVRNGVKLRSLLEASIIDMLERRDGLRLGETLLYEDVATRVQWFDADGKSHTYIPDLHDVINQRVYEVKPAWRVREPTDVMVRKEIAARSAFVRFDYLTEEDL